MRKARGFTSENLLLPPTTGGGGRHTSGLGPSGLNPPVGVVPEGPRVFAHARSRVCTYMLQTRARRTLPRLERSHMSRRYKRRRGRGSQSPHNNLTNVETPAIATCLTNCEHGHSIA